MKTTGVEVHQKALATGCRGRRGQRSCYDRMRRCRRLMALLAVVMLAAGCVVTVGGAAQPASLSTPQSLTGRTIKHVLLGDSALSRILKEPLNIDPRFPPRFGGPETLQDEMFAWPNDCLGVAVMLQQYVYQSRSIKGVAAETWRHAAMSSEVTSVKEGVVSLPTAADANALFAEFSQQWQKCDGTTLPLPGAAVRLKAKITDVEAATSVVAATVSTDWASPSSDSESIAAGRAIGVQGNCLIEVEVDFFNTSNPPRHRPGDINTSAIDIARAMMDKVSALK